MPAPRAPWRPAWPCGISCTSRCIVQTVGPGAFGAGFVLLVHPATWGERGEKGLLLLGQKLLLGGRLLH